MKTQEDYEEWKRATFQIYKDIDHLVDAVWNQFYEDAKRDGFVDELEADEDDVADLIRWMISEAKA